MKNIIIADLHLTSDTTIFQYFCENIAPNYDNLYILGDLFDMYLGDDLLPNRYQNIADILKTLSTQTHIFIMSGNRDFLIGNGFAKYTHATIITEPYILQTAYKNYVLIHGDSLVTKDKSYQRFKKIIQNKVVKKLLLSLPKKMRNNVALNIQQKSKTSKQHKSAQIMDIDECALQDFMQNYPNADIIHGHTHKQKIHTYASFKRFVLGDWKISKELQLGNFLEIVDDKVQYGNVEIK